MPYTRGDKPLQLEPMEGLKLIVAMFNMEHDNMMKCLGDRPCADDEFPTVLGGMAAGIPSHMYNEFIKAAEDYLARQVTGILAGLDRAGVVYDPPPQPLRPITFRRWLDAVMEPL